MKAAAASAADQLQRTLARGGLHVEARWVPAVNLHITLWFLGEVEADRVPRICESVSVPFDVPRFTLRAGGLGAFPSSGPPRVFWMGVTTGGESLAALHTRLASRLAPLGFEPERRAYSAHLTLARVRDVARGAAADVRRLLAGITAEAGSMEVSAATLFRSRVSSRGAAYEPLLRVPLQ